MTSEDAADPMDEQLVFALARIAGLHRALEKFPADVAAAAAQAFAHRSVVQAPEDPTAEPWPPMRPDHTT